MRIEDCIVDRFDSVTSLNNPETSPTKINTEIIVSVVMECLITSNKESNNSIKENKNQMILWSKFSLV